LPVLRITYDSTPTPYFIRGDGLPKPPPVSMSRIQAVVCRHFDVSKIDLIGERRHPEPTRARHVAIYLARTMTTKSLPEIGRHMGGRDHTTILHAYRKIAGLVAEDARFASELAILEHKIKNGEG
jgi:chromosomal replication initiator protein